MTVRISGTETARTLDVYRESTWNSFKEQQPIHMTFLEEDLAALYNNDEKTAIVFSIFSVLAIFIAALGLLGLASFSAAQRTKEVGIRKAMGASIPSVLLTLSREFIWLILYGNPGCLAPGLFLYERLVAGFSTTDWTGPDRYLLSAR